MSTIAIMFGFCLGLILWGGLWSGKGAVYGRDGNNNVGRMEILEPRRLGKSS